MTQPRPILVLGVNRSGTKWLCNEIGRHPAVAVVAHRDHGGVLETNLLTHYGRSFDFNDPDGYRSFLDFWTRTHFFSIAGGRREDFEQGDRPAGPVEAFRRLMDDFARSRNATFWVQKVGPMNAAYVLQRFPDAHIVVIHRELVDTVRSRLKLDRDRNIDTTAFRAALSIVIQMREIASVSRGRAVFQVRYEQLRANREETLSEVAAFLGLDDAVWHEHDFPRNTSFSNDGERKNVIGSRDLLAIRVAKAIVQCTPHLLLRVIRSQLTRSSLGILPGTFRHTETERTADQSGS